jgi:phosphoribosylglycinamide formyltransferase 1
VNQTPALRRSRLVVLISGSGSNLQALLDAISENRLQADVVVVISNKAEAYGLERARLACVPAVVKTSIPGQERRAYDAELAEIVQAYQPDWVILAGWMRILSSAFLEAFQNQVINLHPALPGMFPGTHAIERALAAYQTGEIQETGVMVHFVPDEGVDCGPVIAQRKVPIFHNDTLETLAGRIHQTEHQLLVDAIAGMLQSTAPLSKTGDNP